MYKGRPIMASATILVVENCEEELARIRSFLGEKNYIPISADSGQRALNLAMANPTFDMILFSASIEDIPAPEFCKRLTENPATASMPVVLIVDEATTVAIVHESLEAGLRGCIARPVNPTVFDAWLKILKDLARIKTSSGEMSGAAVPCDPEVLQRFSKLSHAVNNPMQGVYATADMLGFSLPEGSRERELVENIIKYARQASDLVADAAKAAKEQLNR